MRKVAIVTSYPFEDTNAAKPRMEAFKKVLEESSDVFLLCRRSLTGIETEKNIVEVPMFNISQNNFILRGIAELIFSVRLVFSLRRMHPDVAIVTVPSVFLLLAALWKNCPTIIDVRDLVWTYLPENGPISRLIKAGLSRFAYAMLDQAAAILVTNVAEEKAIRNKVKEDKVIRKVSNGISASRYEILTACNASEATRPERGSLNVLYIGNIGLAQDLSTLLEVAKLAEDIKFTIVGKGSDRRRIVRLVETLSLENVRLVDGVPWDSLLDYYRHADVLYAQVVDGYDSAIPSKLYEYFTVGVPVVYAGTGASREFASRFSGVACIPPSDAETLKVTLENVAQLRRNLDVEDNRRVIREEYLRESQARIVNDVLDGLLPIAD